MADQTPESLMADAVLSQKEDPSALSVMMNNRAIFWGGLLLLIFVVVAIFGPLFVGDPVALNPTKRLKPPSAEIFFGSDFLGRDIFSRVIYGARISLAVGIAVAVISVIVGLFLGLVVNIVGDGLRDTLDPRIARKM